MGADAVFISYSHDSAAHSARVLAFSDKLRGLGVDVELDQYLTRPPQGWPFWCEECLRPENAKHVMICTPTYRNRVENRVAADEGRGVYWEGSVVYQYIYKEKANERFIPVLFGDGSDESVPIRMQGFATFRIKAFDLSDAGFEALYRELTGQPAIIKPGLGAKVVLGAKAIPAPVIATPLPEKPALTTFETAAPPVDISRIDRYAPAELIGREAETKLIEDAWAKAVGGQPQRPRVMAFVALGGEGKTALVAKWAVSMAEKGWPDAEAALGWSFYSQGSSEHQASSSDLFLAEALKFFGAPAIEGESPHDKGRRLAACVGAKRAALILDGLEPLQYPPTSPLAGQLKDEGLSALLKSLVQSSKGLCVVTTRYRIRDIEAYAAAAPQRELAPLSKEANARLLDTLGVNGTRQERERLGADAKGHALTLTIIGGYLRDAYGGDIRQRDRIKLEEADAEEQGGHAFRAMDAYAEWFESDGERGRQALAMLRLLGLFDRPADALCVAALLRRPAIEGLTEPLIALSEAQRNIVLTRLASAKLATVNRASGGALVSLDAHPLLREYFAKDLRESRPEAWKAGHKRLYEHLTSTTPDKPAPTLDDLQPLYQAVAHGCLAGMHEEACDNVYIRRIQRGMGQTGFYSTNMLGAFGADLGAVACFFEPPWRVVSPPPAQAWLFGLAAFRLRALGRLTEALEPMQAALEMAPRQKDWVNAGTRAGNLSELELVLGSVDAAIHYGQSAVVYAERTGDAFERLFHRTTHADALHQAGRRPEAKTRFDEAESIQAEAQPQRQLLYSAQGFRYCDLLLGDAERGAWQGLIAGDDKPDPPRSLSKAAGAVGARAEQTLDWTNSWSEASLLTIGLNHLTLARAALYAAILQDEPPVGTRLNETLSFLRRAGEQRFLPLAHLTRALFCALSGAFDEARQDLDEAYEIAERGPMRLFLADIHLHRARLFGLMASRPAAYSWTSPRDDLDAAEKLINECGYGRRREELADAAAAYQQVYGRTRDHDEA
jgi:tetratricopeptide (TPR) repeat protein